MSSLHPKMSPYKNIRLFCAIFILSSDFCICMKSLPFLFFIFLHVAPFFYVRKFWTEIEILTFISTVSCRMIYLNLCKFRHSSELCGQDYCGTYA